MTRPRQLSGLLAAGVFAWTAALGQLSIPRIVQLPTEDFVYNWGQSTSFDERTRPDFNLRGTEAQFQCTLTGSFRPSSRMRDFYNLRDFEQSLTGTLYFIQEATYTLNDLYLANQLRWATLNCIIPESIESESKQQERLDKALERAERQRERRRAED